MQKIGRMKETFRSSGLHTVCESAKCPNMGTCWGARVATFMILGGTCTRACRFCAVPAGRPMEGDQEEPNNVALNVKALNLRFVVITSVARDDLKDEGAEHFARTIAAIRTVSPQTKIEILIPDFSNKFESLEIVAYAKPEVISHNIETVERLSSKIRPQAEYRRSLSVLENFKKIDAAIFTKSSVMVGLGETLDEIAQTMKDLRSADCDILTVGQYLAPTEKRRHLPEDRFAAPEEFEQYRVIGKDMGFKHVMSGPLVRSSFLAEQGYSDCMKEQTIQ